MIVDIASGGVPVVLALLVCLGLQRLLADRPMESRGVAGLGLSVVLLVLSLCLPALAWLVRPPHHPLAFVASVLVFYWISLMILVLTIIRWLRTGVSPQANAVVRMDDQSLGNKK